MKNANKKSKVTQKNQVRVISGQLKKRNIPFVDADGLRPTPDRLKETLFNWLMGFLQDATVLDMCAGSGSLGIECLSRGASFCVFIEPNVHQAKLLAQTLTDFKLSDKHYQVIGQTAQIALPTLTTSFDLVFVDPPYNLNLWQVFVDLLMQYRLIHQDSLIYLEGDRQIEQMIANTKQFEIVKESKVGQIWAYLLRLQG